MGESIHLGRLLVLAAGVDLVRRVVSGRELAVRSHLRDVETVRLQVLPEALVLCGHAVHLGFGDQDEGDQSADESKTAADPEGTRGLLRPLGELSNIERVRKSSSAGPRKHGDAHIVNEGRERPDACGENRRLVLSSHPHKEIILSNVRSDLAYSSSKTVCSSGPK